MMEFIKAHWRQSTVGRSARVLSHSDRQKVLLVIALQTLMGFLDLLGVALIGVLGALAVSGIESKTPGSRVSALLKILGISHYPFTTQAAILGICASAVLIGRTIFSVIFTRRTLHFLSRRGALISSNLVHKLLRQSILRVQQKTTQETVFALTTGVNSITLGILGTAVSLVSDTSLLTVMSIGLFLVDPIIALTTLLVFTGIGFALYRLLQVRAKSLGNEVTNVTIEVNEKIIEVLDSYREAVVKGRRSFYARSIRNSSLRLSHINAEISFLPYISKYIIETSVILGSLFISAIQFYLVDATHAVGTLSIFMAAGARIAPAILRVQQGAIIIKGSLGTARPTLELIESLPDGEEIDQADMPFSNVHGEFDPRIKIQSLNFKYPNSEVNTLSDITIELSPGDSLAIVGSSGAGKTTLADILLGVLEPASGTVKISDMNPNEAILNYPGAIGYVPQNVTIINGSIRENVALGYTASEIPDSVIWDSLKIAQLEEFALEKELGLDAPVGENGSLLSGGQRQRLGIARALVSSPSLLVLDEATSALDGETENSITESISKLKGKTTVVLIAHRLSTIRNVDSIVYLEKGKIIGSGTFEELKANVPQFDIQAKRMGL